jgi:hypothetical protein
MSAVPETPDLRVIQGTTFKRAVLCERADNVQRDLRANAFLTNAAVFEADILNPANAKPFVAHR